MLPYGAGAQNFGVKTYAETADQIRAATIVGNDKFVVSDTQKIPAPVPEGVQGKEPQTTDFGRKIKPAGLFLLKHPQLPLWEKTGQAEQREDGLWIHYAAICTLLRDKENNSYSSGEATGRRTAITELQDLLAFQVKGKHAGNHTFSSDCYQCGVETASKVVTRWCAELQEKTK